MRSLSFASLLVLSSAIFTGCTFGSQQTTTDDEQAASSSSSAEYVATPNVTYVGTVQNLDDSLGTQGTHVLNLTRDGFVYLRAADQGMDLDRYVDSMVEVRGSVQPTTDGNGILMSVSEVTVLEDAMSSSESSAMTNPQCGGIAGIACPAGQECVDDPSDSCDPSAGGADCGGICVTASSSSSVAVASASSSSADVRSSSSSSVESSASTSSSEAGSAASSAITLMASQDYSAALWTQKYCTTHIAFCIPAHKNWYYKSFGATTSNLWHVEFAMESIESIGTGPIVLNLVDSTVEAAGATDGAVQTKGSEVIGFVAWNDGTHFEIIADSSLSAAVSYMTSHITPFSPEE